MIKDFKNIVVINYEYTYNNAFEENLVENAKELTRDKWFNYVVSGDVIDSLRTILENTNIDKSILKRIVYDDVVNSKNAIYSSISEQKAIDQASRSSENCIILELKQ